MRPRKDGAPGFVVERKKTVRTRGAKAHISESRYGAPAFLRLMEKAVSLSLDNPPYRDETAKGWGTRSLFDSWMMLGEDDAGAVGGFVFYGLEGFVGLV
jgi:hypothetical protein